MTDELKVARLINEVIPHGYTTHAKVYSEIADFCLRIERLRGISQFLFIVSPEDLPLYQEIEESNLPRQIIENLRLELIKHPLVWSIGN